MLLGDFNVTEHGAPGGPVNRGRTGVVRENRYGERIGVVGKNRCGGREQVESE